MTKRGQIMNIEFELDLLKFHLNMYDVLIEKTKKELFSIINRRKEIVEEIDDLKSKIEEEKKQNDK